MVDKADMTGRWMSKKAEKEKDRGSQLSDKEEFDLRFLITLENIQEALIDIRDVLEKYYRVK